MNKKLFLIFALAFLCFALPRVAAQETEFETEVGETETGVDTETPVVDEEKCTNCGKCIRFCPMGAFKKV